MTSSLKMAAARWPITMKWGTGGPRCFVCKERYGLDGRFLGVWTSGSDYKTLCQSCGEEYERRMNERG